MNLATANTVGNTPTAFVTTRNTGIGVQGVETQSLSQSRDEFSSFGQGASDTKTLSPYIARYPTVAFTYNEDASRLIMLFRDPASGQKISQIPSEVVVKQYEEVQTAKRRSERPNFQVVVGGAAASKTDSVNGTDNGATAGGALTGVVAVGSATDGAGSSAGGSTAGGYAGTASGGAYGGSSSGGSFGAASGSVTSGVGTGGSGSSGILGSGASGGGTVSLNLVI